MSNSNIAMSVQTDAENTYCVFPRAYNSRTGKTDTQWQTPGLFLPEVGAEERETGKGPRTFWCDWNVLKLDFGGDYTGIYVFQNWNYIHLNGCTKFYFGSQNCKKSLATNADESWF